MSFGAGGLAQMTYNGNNLNGGLGLPGSGYASRAKAGHNKRMSVTPAIKIPAIDEAPQGPRTSRSHLLAGLRTAPRDGATTAPPTQLHFPGGLNDTRSAEPAQAPQAAVNPPQQQPAFAAAPQQQQQQQPTQQTLQAPGRRGHQYTPSQVLAPPAIQLGDENGEGMDPGLYEELVRTNEYLAQQQLRLRQQLINVTAAAQQFQGMNLNQQQQFAAQAQMNPAMGFYGQQLQNGLQPMVEAVPGQPGLYLVYNPMTGQSSYFFDQSQQLEMAQQMAAHGMHDLSSSPPPPTPTFRVSPSPDTQAPKSQTTNNWRSSSPPKSAPTPPREEATPLPPPSANAFRPGHRKEMSVAAGLGQSLSHDTLKNKPIQYSASPQPSTNGTFGPGHQREGEHPMRQPRGPPSLEEIMAKPTTKFEGSKNFATRQRRRAVHDLVRAGIDRRGTSKTRSEVSSGSASPVNESEPTYSASSETDNDSITNGIAGLSGKTNPMRPLISRAIGSERKELKERRNSGDSHITANSITSDEGASIGGKIVEIRADGHRDESEPRKSNLSLLAGASKRRNVVY